MRTINQSDGLWKARQEAIERTEALEQAKETSIFSLKAARKALADAGFPHDGVAVVALHEMEKKLPEENWNVHKEKTGEKSLTFEPSQVRGEITGPEWALAAITIK